MCCIVVLDPALSMLVIQSGPEKILLKTKESVVIRTIFYGPPYDAD